ncbi:MAG TPA: extracellular solute-binding protein [Actinopolymorphaceae bacterium]
MTENRSTLARRGFLGGIAGVAAAFAAGCDTAAPTTKTGGPRSAKSGATSLKWWDHTPNMQPANKKVFAAFEKEPGGVPVDYTYHPTSKLGQALQLAKQSGQLPDVHSLAGLRLPVPGLIKAGWLRPIELSDEALARLPEDKLVEGIHLYDGKLYSVPIFTDKQYWAANWFNKQIVQEAGLDPASPPRTYDEFRAAARAVKRLGKDGVSAWLFNLGFASRVAEHVNFLAQGAGFEGFDGVRYRTGEIAYHDEAYVTVLEFLLSLHKDGLLFPGSQSLDDKIGRIRWAAGAAAFFFDGPWCAGDITRDAAAFTEKLDVGPMLVPETSRQVTAYRAPAGGMYWLSKSARAVDEANQLLGHLTTPDYYVDIASGMAQPPLDLTAVDKADVHPAWRKLVGWYAEDVFTAPVPVVKNPDVAKVAAETKDVTPGLGELVQGMFAGDVKDVAGALKQLSDKTAAAREDALAAARKKGARVDLDDWAFPNWQPRRDFTNDQYQ